MREIDIHAVAFALIVSINAVLVAPGLSISAPWCALAVFCFPNPMILTRAFTPYRGLTYILVNEIIVAAFAIAVGLFVSGRATA